MTTAEQRLSLLLGTFVIDNGDGTYDACAVGNEFLISVPLPEALKFISQNLRRDSVSVRCFDRKANCWTSELDLNPKA